MGSTTELTLLYVGTFFCGNCKAFSPEWNALKSRCSEEGNERVLNIEGYTLNIEEYVVNSHDALPTSIMNTVTFYPFIMLLPTKYYRENLNNPDPDFVFVGEAMYTYRSLVNGKIKYRLGSSVNESPNMRYPRTADGILDWIRDSAITSLQVLSVKYYPEITFMDTAVKVNKLTMRALERKQDELDTYIPTVNKEYNVISGGMVLCRRILNVHS